MHPSKGDPVGDSLTRAWTAGIDWVTYIARDKHAQARLSAMYHELVREFVDRSAKKKPFRCGGYQGCRIGALSLGQLGHSSMLQLSGEVAAKAATRLVSLGGQPTRLDVQMTLSLPTSQPLLYERFLSPSTRTTTPCPSRRPLIGWRMDTRGLALGTVGDRTKCRYLRVYDKGVESNLAPVGHLWRLELEAKKSLAPALWSDWQRAKDQEQWCYDTLSEQWRRSHVRWPLTESTRGVRGVVGSKAKPSDAANLARWARTSVAPALERLARTYSREQINAMLWGHEHDAV